MKQVNEVGVKLECQTNSAYSGDKIYNFRTVAHSFRAKGEKGYSFICVQTPGIDNPKFDDWIPAKVNDTQPETNGLLRGERHQALLASV